MNWKTVSLSVVFLAANSEQTPSLVSLREGIRAGSSALRHAVGLHDETRLPRVLIMVSRFDHCLNDLLYRWRMGELRMKISAIVSNHSDLAPLAEAAGMPFHHLHGQRRQPQRTGGATGRADRQHRFRTGRARPLHADTFSGAVHASCRTAINIHHSFLPGFKGAKPYHQAHARGVKLIGATAHYVTTDLDEGPIIEQVVERVKHSHRAEDLLAVGREWSVLHYRALCAITSSSGCS